MKKISPKSKDNQVIGWSVESLHSKTEWGLAENHPVIEPIGEFLDCASTRKKIKEWYGAYLGTLESTGHLVLESLKCQSPIEHLLFWAMVEEWKLFGRKLDRPSENLIESGLIFEEPLEFGFLHVQKSIEIGAGFITPDITIQIADFRDTHEPSLCDYCIELNGHDFHEKTKEQVARDKKRDRLLLMKGKKVMRFAGSEIYKDPIAAVKEIEAIIGLVRSADGL